MPGNGRFAILPLNRILSLLCTRQLCSREESMKTSPQDPFPPLSIGLSSDIPYILIIQQEKVYKFWYSICVLLRHPKGGSDDLYLRKQLCQNILAVVVLSALGYRWKRRLRRVRWRRIIEYCTFLIDPWFPNAFGIYTIARATPISMRKTNPDPLHDLHSLTRLPPPVGNAPAPRQSVQFPPVPRRPPRPSQVRQKASFVESLTNWTFRSRDGLLASEY
jgi:hypothetical protein